MCRMKFFLCLLAMFLPAAAMAETAQRYYPVDGSADSWCDADQHVCIGLADTAAGRTAWHLTGPFAKPVKMDEEIGASCTFERRVDGSPDPKILRGRIMESYRGKRFLTFCQPAPRDGLPSWNIQYEPGRHAASATVDIVFPVSFSAPADGDRAVIDCLDGVSAGRDIVGGKACVGARGSTGLSVRKLIIKVGERQPDGRLRFSKGSDAVYRCIWGAQNTLVEDTDCLGVRHGIQASITARRWVLRRVRFVGIDKNGKTHPVYTSPSKIGIPHETLIIEDSYIENRCAGLGVKSNSLHTIIRNTTIITGSGRCDTGFAVHNNGGTLVELENVRIVQPDAPNGNAKIFVSGAIESNIGRCVGDGNGEWRLKNVTVEDRDARKIARVKSLCPGGPARFVDLGGNTYRWVNNGFAVQDLFDALGL